MKPIRYQRLANQGLIQPEFNSPAEVVHWMGAVQAQDYLGSLWEIGLRMRGATERLIEQAIEARKIIRTWPMRGTIHFVPAEDASWMVRLMGPRVTARIQSIYRKAGLDENAFAHSHEVIVRALEGGKRRTRKDLYAQLEAEGIATADGRGLHIIGYLARQGLICFGPRQGRQPTFTLLDEWVPRARNLEGEEALAEIALRYFRSHGPATIRDFVWWTGLQVAEAQVGIEAVNPKLLEETIDGMTYWSAETRFGEWESSQELFILPSYDEYLVSYKDRSAALNPQYKWLLKAENHLRSTIIIDGQVIGNWKRTFKKGAVKIEARFARDLSSSERQRYEDAVHCYAKFLEKPVDL
jgi:hypothetical protein